MRKKLGWIILGILIGLCVTVFRYDIQDAVQAAASHMDRLVLGSGNYGTDPNTTADITGQNDEYWSNATDGRWDAGAANLVTTGTLAAGATTITGALSATTDITATSSLILGAQAHQEYVTKVTITTAQVKALNATPISLVATPGANYAIIFLDALALVDYVSAAYVAADGTLDGEDLIISYTDGSGEVAAEIETVGFLDQTNDELRYCTPSAGADGADNAYIIPVANAALVISLLSGEVTTGDSPIEIVIHYKVVATNL